MDGTLKLAYVGIHTQSSGCDWRMKWIYPAKYCDFITYARICVFLMNFTDSEYRNHVKSPGPSFKVNKYGSSISTQKDYLICDEVGYITQNANSNDNWYNPPKVIATYYHYYGQYMHVTTAVSEDNYQFSNLYTTPYLNMVTFVESILTSFESVYEGEKKHYIVEMGFTLYIKYTLSAKCRENFIGHGCWYECVSNKRQSCNCSSQLNPESNCNITCEEGYRYRIISYLIDDVRREIKSCDIIDRCHPIFDMCNGVCLVTGNNTNLCEYPSYNFTSQFAERNKNISSPIWYSSEVIDLKPEINSFSKEFRHFEIKVYMAFNPNSLPFQRSALLQYRYIAHEILVTGYQDKLQVESGIVEFNMFLTEWNIALFFIKKFYIFKPLLKVDISRLISGDIVLKYVALGEELRCNTTAHPFYRVLYQWRSSSLKFEYALDQIQTIDPQADLNMTYLNCTAYFLVPDRKTMVESKVIHARIRIFLYFRWTVSNNVIDITENVSCIVYIGFNHTLLVSQLDGFDEVGIENNKLFLQNISGDFYSFLCILITNRTLYTRIINFNLVNIPKSLCWYIFPYILGAIVQCGHDGYFEDDYNIKVTFYSLNPSPSLYAQNRRYVKIPYSITDSFFEITCFISHIRSPSLMFNSSIISKISKTSSKKYLLNEQNIKCGSSYPYIDYPSIIEETKTYVILAHKIYYETEHIDRLSIYIMMEIITILFQIPFLIMIVNSFYDGPMSQFEETKTFKAQRLLIMRRNIRERLYFIAVYIANNMHEDILITTLFTKSYELNDFSGSSLNRI